MLEAIFELLVPLVCASIIDVGIVNNDRAYILKMGLILFLLAAVGLAVALIAQYFAAKAAIKAAGAMRRDVFYHIMDFSDGVRAGQGESALTTRLTSDIDRVQNGINMFLRLFLRSPFIVFGAFIMSFIVDARASLIYLLVLPLLTLTVVLVMKFTLPMYASIQEKLQRIFTIVDENLSGVRVIRAFRNEESQKKGFLEETEELKNRQLAAGRISVLLGPLTLIVVNMGVIWLLYYSGRMVNIGSLTTGETVALVNYMSQILVELIKLANLILLLTRALSSVKRIEEILNTRPDERRHISDIKPVAAETDDNGGNSEGKSAGKQAGETVLSVRDASFSYGDGRRILEGVSFDLYEGETLGIIGGTGSGKSTLLRLIRHSYDIDSGSIYYRNHDIASYDDETISRAIAIVPQKASLFKGTIRSNLAMGDTEASDEKMWRTLAVAQADKIVADKPGGLDEPVSADGGNFSGGQRQRLTIARALIRNADITMLDDSASALDLLTERRLRDALKESQGNRSYIIVSQRASFVKNADRILVLEHGEQVGYGTHDELMNTCEVYREIYLTQYEEEA